MVLKKPFYVYLSRYKETSAINFCVNNRERGLEYAGLGWHNNGGKRYFNNRRTHTGYPVTQREKNRRPNPDWRDGRKSADLPGRDRPYRLICEAAIWPNSARRRPPASGGRPVNMELRPKRGLVIQYIGARVDKRHYLDQTNFSTLYEFLEKNVLTIFIFFIIVAKIHVINIHKLQIKTFSYVLL